MINVAQVYSCDNKKNWYVALYKDCKLDKFGTFVGWLYPKERGFGHGLMGASYNSQRYAISDLRKGYPRMKHKAITAPTQCFFAESEKLLADLGLKGR